jgi:hypothetical protein
MRLKTTESPTLSLKEVNSLYGFPHRASCEYGIGRSYRPHENKDWSVMAIDFKV